MASVKSLGRYAKQTGAFPDRGHYYANFSEIKGAEAYMEAYESYINYVINDLIRNDIDFLLDGKDLASFETRRLDAKEGLKNKYIVAFKALLNGYVNGGLNKKEPVRRRKIYIYKNFTQKPIYNFISFLLDINDGTIGFDKKGKTGYASDFLSPTNTNLLNKMKPLFREESTTDIGEQEIDNDIDSEAQEINDEISKTVKNTSTVKGSGPVSTLEPDGEYDGYIVLNGKRYVDNRTKKTIREDFSSQIPSFKDFVNENYK